MFYACLHEPPPPLFVDRRFRPVLSGTQVPAKEEALLALAREFSPRVEAPAGGIAVLDGSGLARLFGHAQELGEELRRAAADRGLHPHIAIARTRTAAILLARGRAGLTVIPAGEEATALASLPLWLLYDPVPACVHPSAPRNRTATPQVSSARHDGTSCGRHYRLAPRPVLPKGSGEAIGRQTSDAADEIDRALVTLKRWGLRTLGDLAALPPAQLFERLGGTALWLQRLARGEDSRPLVPDPPEEPFETTLALDWPIEGLEPLSFVLLRLLEPLCDRLERQGAGAVVLDVRLRLITREMHARRLQLPSPLRDARTLRTLLLLDLESHPPPAGIDVVTVAIEPSRAPVVQYSLLARAGPAPEELATLLSRLEALMGSGRSGAAVLVDSHRPGVFALQPFTGGPVAIRGGPAARSPVTPDEERPSGIVLRRFRAPLPALIQLTGNRPVHLTARLPGTRGGRITTCAGPWRTSGGWWTEPWHRDEWDVVLADGAAYRIFLDRGRDRWFVEGEID